MRTVAVAATVALLLVGSACAGGGGRVAVVGGGGSDAAPASDARPEAEVATCTSPPTTNVGQSKAWRDQRAQLLADREAVIAGPLGQMYGPESFTTTPDAYRSEPVDITGPGTYDLRFAMPPGTVLAAFAPRFPSDFPTPFVSLSFPAAPVAGADGYLHASVLVVAPPAGPDELTYPGLTVWLV